MEYFSAEGYELARQVLQRGIAAVFLTAFLAAVAQFPALLGERGLLPAPKYLKRTAGDRKSTRLNSSHWE